MPGAQEAAAPRGQRSTPLGDRGWRAARLVPRVGSCYWLYQVSEKLPLLIADGAAFTVLAETMVIGSMPDVEPVKSEPLTLAPVKPIVPKSASGKTPPLLEGASAIASADPRLADLSRWLVACDQPLVVSLSVSLK